MLGHVGCVGLTILIMGGLVYFARSLKYDLARVSEMPERSIIYDRNKKELGRLHGAHRYVVDLNEVSPNFRLALLAREDKDFEKHFGVDPRGVARAVYQNIKRGRLAQGASTLTMQLARNAFHLPTNGPKWKQLDRKFLEIALVFRIEARYDKDEILQHYMNLIFWGGSIHGVEAASRAYLEKSAKDLTLSEGAMLAGIIRAPNAFSPFEDLESTKRERDGTLDSMVRYGFIKEAEAKTAKAEPLHIRPKGRRIIHGSYAMDAIRRDIGRFLDKEDIKRGGLQIITTIDKDLQEAAERHLNSKLSEIERGAGYRHPTRTNWQSKPAMRRGAPDYLQGAVVVVENRTGAIRTIVGGRDADESKFNRALHARRQMGSVFKPFVYLAAFDRGLRPNTWIEDGRLKPGEIKCAPKNWDPANSDGKYYKLVSVKDALVKSRNTSSVRVGNFAGMDNVRDVAYQALAKKMPAKAAAYLGAWEATPEQVASAYTIFPNGGTRYGPHFVSKILDRNGKVLYDHKPIGYRAARAGAAWSVSALLQDVTKTGTASAMRRTLSFHKPAGGKTGTTDEYQDAWFVGYSSSLTCAVWVGLDQPKTIMKRGYGSSLALPIWVKVMKTADRLGRYRFAEFTPPIELEPCRLCRYSGKRATPGCELAKSAYNGQAPTDLAPASNDFCTSHPLRALPVDDPIPPRAQSVPEPRRALRAIPVD
jgi:penicillin-binding protein 1A